MATVKPFLCVKPREDLGDQIAALPYDVYTRGEAKVFVKDHPYTFLKIDRPESQFEDGIDIYDKVVYQKAGDTLKEMLEKGEFVTAEKKGYYIYELTMQGRSQTGIVACVAVDDYLNNVVKKHENTRTDKEEDRVRHIEACGAQTGPVFLMYRKNQTIKDVIEAAKKNAPIFDFCGEDEVQHKVWELTGEDDMAVIQTEFAQIPQLYIADGHHRASAAVQVAVRRRADKNVAENAECEAFMAVLFPDDELLIMDYNRVVHDLNGYTVEEFLEKVQSEFDVTVQGTAPYSPKKPGEFGMFLGGKWYQVQAKDAMKTGDPVKDLDVYILQNYLLQPTLGINDPKTDTRIHFVGGIKGIGVLAEQAASYENGVAFAMYPPSIQSLFDVADAGMLMPPKSTWFEPKLRSGLFIHQI